MAKNVQLQLTIEDNELREEFEGFKNFQAQNLFNRLVDLRNSIEISEQSFKGKIKNLKGTKETALKALEEVKNNADIVGILPSAKRLLKIFNDLRLIANNADLNIEDHEDNTFIQKYYRFFYKATNGISKDNKEKLLTDSSLIKDIKVLYNENKNISNKEFQSLVKIFKLKIENNINDISVLANLYHYNSYIKRNFEKISLIHQIGSDNGISFELVQANLVELLSIIYLSEKVKSEKAIKDNVKKYLNILTNNSNVTINSFLKEIREEIKSTGKKINEDISFTIYSACKIAIGNNKKLQLKTIKELLDTDISEKQLKKILILQNPAKKDSEEFNKLLQKIDIDEVSKTIKQKLS